MAALPFYQYRKAVSKPPLKQFNPNPRTVGEHIRKVRIQRGLLQKDAAVVLKVSEDCVTYWESERSSPQVKHYPAIIAFLGYYPLEHETETIAGKLRQIRYCNGFDFGRCAKFLHVSVDAARRWEGGKPISNPRLRAVIEAVWQALPKCN